jgi:hypothetical protein
MRGTRCRHCKTNFNPKRRDAIYCCDLCKQAAYHKRKKVADTAAAAATSKKRQAEAIRTINQYDTHQTIMTMLRAAAKVGGIDVKFAPSSSGVLAVEGRPGAFDQAHAMLASFPYLSHKAVDPDLAREDWLMAADRKDKAYTVASLENPGTSLVAKEAQEEFANALSRGEASVIELRTNKDYIPERNRAARFRNDGAKFLGLRGFRCPRCGTGRAGRDGWECCGEAFDTQTPDEPRGFPHPRASYG